MLFLDIMQERSTGRQITGLQVQAQKGCLARELGIRVHRLASGQPCAGTGLTKGPWRAKGGSAFDFVLTLDYVASGVALHGPFCSSSEAETTGVENEFLPGHYNAIRYPGMTTTLGLLMRYSVEGRQFWNLYRG